MKFTRAISGIVLLLLLYPQAAAKAQQPVNGKAENDANAVGRKNEKPEDEDALNEERQSRICPTREIR